MPVILPIADLRSGMRLARPLLREGKLLYTEGTVLSPADLDVLMQRHADLQAVVHDPLIDEAASFDDDDRRQAVSTNARRKFAQTVRQAQEHLQTQASLRHLDVNAVESALGRIVHFLQGNPLASVFVTGPESGEQPWVEHSGNVFYLAMVLGNAVRAHICEAARQPRRQLGTGSMPKPPDLAQLGLAALLMDISLWSVHTQLDHPGPLTATQRELVFDHPRMSANMLPADVAPATRNAVLHHHENNNGTGYPRQITGGDIPLFARILRMADAYSAATAPRTYRPAKSTVRAFWELTCGPCADFYDPVILKLFQATVQPYPIGARVRLACGRHAVVVRHGQHHGLLPEVLIAFDDQGRPLSPEAREGPHRLDRHPELRIVSFRGEDLGYVYGNEPFDEASLPAPPAEFQTFSESLYP